MSGSGGAVGGTNVAELVVSPGWRALFQTSAALGWRRAICIEWYPNRSKLRVETINKAARIEAEMAQARSSRSLVLVSAFESKDSFINLRLLLNSRAPRTRDTACEMAPSGAHALFLRNFTALLQTTGRTALFPSGFTPRSYFRNPALIQSAWSQSLSSPPSETTS